MFVPVRGDGAVAEGVEGSLGPVCLADWLARGTALLLLYFATHCEK